MVSISYYMEEWTNKQILLNGAELQKSKKKKQISMHFI